MITGEQLIEKEIATETELAAAVEGGTVTALDQKRNPIDWSQLEADFSKIQKLSQEPVPVTRQPARKHHLLEGLEDRSARQPKVVRKNRFQVRYDEIKNPKTGETTTTPRVPWKKLLSLLEDGKYNIIIPMTQEMELMEGWGINTMLPYVRKAYYRPEEFKKLAPPYLNEEHPYYCPEIAALIKTWLAFYEHGNAKPEQHRKGNQAMIKWMEEHIHDVKWTKDNLKGKDPYLLKILNGGNRLREKLHRETFKV